MNCVNACNIYVSSKASLLVQWLFINNTKPTGKSSLARIRKVIRKFASKLHYASLHVIKDNHNITFLVLCHGTISNTKPVCLMKKSRKATMLWPTGIVTINTDQRQRFSSLCYSKNYQPQSQASLSPVVQLELRMVECNSP